MIKFINRKIERKLSRQSICEGGRIIFMFYIYILRSKSYPQKTYTGYTINLKQRLADHNCGESVHTAKYGPWRLETYFAFEDESVAIKFEKYLKSGSGRAFAKKHFLKTFL